MSVSDMVWQLLFVTPESITGVGTVIAAGEKTKEALETYPVGGIMYSAANFKSRSQTIEMIQNTQDYSKIPLFIAVDEEGGRVSRLGSNSEMGVTKEPPMREIGDGGDTSRAYEVGATLGSELSALGFNVDFAPVADVLVNPDNTEIGDRSFGTDPELVSGMVSALTKGLSENGVSATLKHFPGHGSTTVNSHTGRSVSERTIDALRSCELLPFKAGIEAGADFVMVSHMTLEKATEAKLPSSLSREVITDLLKTELGFDGIIITDSFSMGAITEEYDPGDAAVMAINAGADMILMPEDPVSVHDTLLSAVESGKISKERMEESVRKILSLKKQKGLI